jgi:putative transposase
MVSNTTELTTEAKPLSHSITLTPDQRGTLLRYYRGHCPPQLRLRAHIVLLLADGRTWDDIAGALYCSTRTIARWKDRFQGGGTQALFGQPAGAPRRLGAGGAALVVAWVLRLTPRAFGLCRSRWCCQTLALLLWRQHGLGVSRETVRRWLHQADIVWRRPRPVMGRADPERGAILQRLRALLRDLPDDETAVFEDEVDLSLNPEVGCTWMARGQQAVLPTPGDNDKCYLAGSLHWRTGALFQTVGPRRDGVLFARHLDELRRRLRRYRVIHVICDNAKFHTHGAVVQFLKEHGDRVKVHLLPRYAPDCNPVERVWWRLREAITRNHSCHSLGELVDLVLSWLTERKSFRVKDSVYQAEDVRGSGSQTHEAA